MNLGIFMYTPGTHLAGWRHPEAVPGTDMSYGHHVAMVQAAERALMDLVFFQDSNAVPGSMGLRGRSPLRPEMGRQVHLEPVSLIAALAPVTRRIGLIATATTTYNDPYSLARRFATIDHISDGRCGWNVVTSQVEDEAANFGFEQHALHADRYERASEFVDVVAGLWDSWDDDAFIHDKSGGRFYDEQKVHFLNHRGRHFSVRGPLNVARPPQGHPVIAQAGSSEVGKELGARTADLIFTAQTELGEAQAFYADLKRRVAGHGRDPDAVRILPGLMPILGRSDAEAEEKFAELQELLSDEMALHTVARLTGSLDITCYPLDGPLPELPPSNAAQGRQKLLVDMARREGLSIRQLARRLAQAGFGHQFIVGSPNTVADRMQEWFEARAADGFNLLMPYYPGPMEMFLSAVVPELQRRGLFRTAYAGTTLRENLGVPVPSSRYAA